MRVLNNILIKSFVRKQGTWVEILTNGIFDLQTYMLIKHLIENNIVSDLKFTIFQNIYEKQMEQNIETVSMFYFKKLDEFQKIDEILAGPYGDPVDEKFKDYIIYNTELLQNTSNAVSRFTDKILPELLNSQNIEEILDKTNDCNIIMDDLVIQVNQNYLYYNLLYKT